MKYFVTGGAGFIGSHLVDRLINDGNFVTVYDNLSSGKKNFIETHFGKSTFNFIEADLLDQNKITNSISDHDIVVHLSANPDIRKSNLDTSLDLKQETLATYNVLEAMRINNLKRIVFSSSSAIYGETPIIPLAEDYGPLLPISFYGAAKLSCEALISAFCNVFTMQSWIFRFANIVGNRATHGVIFDFINKLKTDPNTLEILGDGSQRKPYLHVDDCVDGILYGLNNSNNKINIFNLGCSTSTDVSTIAKYVINELNLGRVNIKYTGGVRGWVGDVPQVRLNINKLDTIGWRARYSSDDAIKKAIKDIIK